MLDNIPKEIDFSTVLMEFNKILRIIQSDTYNLHRTEH